MGSKPMHLIGVAGGAVRRSDLQRLWAAFVALSRVGWLVVAESHLPDRRWPLAGAIRPVAGKKAWSTRQRPATSGPRKVIAWA